jgi:hypothetical protein
MGTKIKIAIGFVILGLIAAIVYYAVECTAEPKGIYVDSIVKFPLEMPIECSVIVKKHDGYIMQIYYVSGSPTKSKLREYIKILAYNIKDKDVPDYIQHVKSDRISRPKLPSCGKYIAFGKTFTVTNKGISYGPIGGFKRRI